MALELVQVVCAFGIVVAYGLLQLGRARARGPAFLAMNLICAAGMGATAVLDFQPGFVITNGLWVRSPRRAPRSPSPWPSQLAAAPGTARPPPMVFRRGRWPSLSDPIIRWSPARC